MSGIARQSKFHGPFEQSESPLVLPHAAWAGLSILLEDEAAELVVAADFNQDGDFENIVEMLGGPTEDSSGAATKFRYPSATGANLLYNAGYIEITWDTGTVQVLQKG
jgi:hypothetical protein